MSPAEVAACNRLSEPAKSNALAAFRALDALTRDNDALLADIAELKAQAWPVDHAIDEGDKELRAMCEATGVSTDEDLDAEWVSLQRRVDGREIRQ